MSATHHLQARPSRHSSGFIGGNFFTVVPDLVGNSITRFDAVMASFALHHLLREEKEQTIAELHPLLEPDGVFLLADVVRPQGETREDALYRYLSDVRRDGWEIAPDMCQLKNICSREIFPKPRKRCSVLPIGMGFATS